MGFVQVMFGRSRRIAYVIGERRRRGASARPHVRFVEASWIVSRHVPLQLALHGTVVGGLASGRFDGHRCGEQPPEVADRDCEEEHQGHQEGEFNERLAALASASAGLRPGRAGSHALGSITTRLGADVSAAGGCWGRLNDALDG